MAKKEIIKLTTPVFVAAFPSLYEATAMEGSKPKFSVTAIWDPSKFTAQDKVLWKAMLDEAERVSQEAFKKPWKNLPSDKRGIRDGAEKDLEGFGEGKRFANLSTLLKPGVFDLSGNEIIDPADIYPGCLLRATVNWYAYDNKSKGCSLGLRNIQKINDGKRLDGRGDGSKDFAETPVDESWLEAHTDSLLDDPDDGF